MNCTKVEKNTQDLFASNKTEDYTFRHGDCLFIVFLACKVISTSTREVKWPGYVFKQLRFCDIVLFFKGISYFICSSNVSAKFYKNPYSRNPKKCGINTILELRSGDFYCVRKTH